MMKRNKAWIRAHFTSDHLGQNWWLKYDDDRDRKFYGIYDNLPAYARKYLHKWGPLFYK